MGNLSSRTAIDFILDCGADPTGVVDVGPAMDKAFALLSSLATDPRLPKQSSTLLIPPGVYKLNSTPTEWIFVQGTGTSKLILQGSGDSTVFVLGGGALQIAWLIANLEVIEARDFAVVGAGIGAAADTGAGLTFAANWGPYFYNVRFIGIYSASYALKVNGRRAVFEGCEFSGCGCSDVAGANLISFAPLVWRNGQHFDLPFLNGFPIAQTQKTIFGNVEMLVDMSAMAGVQEEYVELSGGLFDEGCFNNIIIKGAPAAPIHHIKFEDIFVNTPGNGIPVGPAFAIHIEYCDFLEMVGCVANIGAGVGPFPFLDLKSVTSSKLNLFLDPAATPYNFIQADAACKSIEIVDGVPNFPGMVSGGAAVQIDTVQTFDTDVTGTPVVTVSFPMPNGSFQGTVNITGRMTNIGAGGGGAAVGDIATRLFVLVAKTVAGVTTYENATDLYGSSLFAAQTKYTDPSIVGTLFTLAAVGGAMDVTVDTTAAAAGAGAIIHWSVTLDGEST